MGQIPLPMQPIPDDATNEEAARIKAEYRAYLEEGLIRSNRMIWWTVQFIIVLALILWLIAFLGR